MKVVVAIDLSPYTTNVIDSLIKRHWPESTQFKIVTIIEPIFTEDLDVDDLSETLHAVMERRKTVALKYCQQAREQLQQGIQGSIVHIDIRQGNPREELINATTEWDADKIVIGAHGRDLCKRFLWGSVSRAVTAHSSCPVEIVRPTSAGDVAHKELPGHAHAVTGRQG